MLKRLPVYIKIAVGAVLIIGTIILVTYEEHHVADKYKGDCQKNISNVTASSEKQDTSPDKCKDPKDYMPWWYILVAWPEGITAWAVIATGFVIAWQSYETRKAANATEKSVEESRATAKKQLRAYVGVKGARLFLHNDGTVELKIEVFNCGQTPAFDFGGAHWGRFSPYPTPKPPPPEQSLRKSIGIIGASLSYHLLGDVLKSGVESRDKLLQMLANPNVCFAVNGIYSYRDVFDEIRWLEFQMFVGGPVKVRTGSDEDGIYAVFCNDKEGNKTT